MKKFLEKMAISGFSGFFGKLLMVIIFFLGSGYIGSKLIGSESKNFWDFMKSTMMLYFLPISMAVVYILSSGTFDRILEWKIKIRELKLKELKIKKEIAELEQNKKGNNNK